MIKLKVFISSVQKELREERIAIGSFLSTDDFLRECTVPRIFEDYPQPLRPNPKAYLDLLRQCQIYLLLIGKEYGSDAGDGLSATHEEYRLAQDLKLPMLICVKGERKTKRDDAVTAFLKEIEDAKHTYSRFENEAELLGVVGKRLREHIEVTYATVPRRKQVEQSALNVQAASTFEREPLPTLAYEHLDPELALDMIAVAEDCDKERVDSVQLPRLLLSRGYLWKDAAGDVLRPTVAGALLLARSPGVALTQARVQMDAYAGADRNAEPVDSVFIDAPLARTVEQAVAFIRRNTPNSLKIRGLKRENTEAYPAEALREVVVNAIAHRDYADPGARICVEVFADRLRVSSPGLPPGGQPVERLASGEARSRSRNPLVVQGLSWLELMDERGSGIRRMTRVLEEVGHPRPVFAIDHDSLVVEFFPVPGEIDKPGRTPRKGVKADLSPNDRILLEVEQSGSVSTKICVQRLGIPRATAQRILVQMVDEGKLEIIGAGPTTRYRLITEAS